MKRPGPAPAGHDARPILGIIGPAFFNYVNAIAQAFTMRGFAVERLDEKHSNGIWRKAMYRAGVYRLPYTAGARHRTALAARLVERGITDVLLVNVESIDRAFVAALAKCGVRMHLYMWDGIANKPGFQDYLDLMSSKASFDPIDCERLGMRYVALFAEPTFAGTQNHGDDQRTTDISFCGTVHSNRVSIMAKLLTADWARRLKVETLLFYHWRSMLYLRGVVNWDVWKLGRRVSFESFSKERIAAMFGRSRFVLDIPHHGQTGMTARTFEVLASGARLLTFNRLAQDLLPGSLRNRIVHIDCIEDVSRIDFAKLPPLPELSPDDAYYLSLDRFVDQLADMMALNIHASADAEVPSAV